MAQFVMRAGAGLDHPVRAARAVAAKGGGWTAETGSLAYLGF